MSAVWALVLEFMNQVTDMGVAQLAAIPISKMNQNLSFKRVVPLAIASSTQYLQRPENIWAITAAFRNISRKYKGGESAVDWTPLT